MRTPPRSDLRFESIPWGRSVEREAQGLNAQYNLIDTNRQTQSRVANSLADTMPEILSRTSELLYLERTLIPEFEYTFTGGGGVQAVQFSVALGLPDLARVVTRERRSIGSVMLEVFATRVSGGTGSMLASPDCSSAVAWSSLYRATIEGGVGQNADPGAYVGQVVMPFAMPGSETFAIGSYYPLDAAFSANPGATDMTVRFTNCKITYIRTGDISADSEAA